MWNLCLFTGKEPRCWTACSAPGVNIYVLATVINSKEIWDFSQHEAITIAPTESINTYLSVLRKEMWEKEEKKRTRGREADGGIDLSQMCIFEARGKYDFNIWEKFCAIMWPLLGMLKWWTIILDGQMTHMCMGVFAGPYTHTIIHIHFACDCVCKLSGTCTQNICSFSRMVMKKVLYLVTTNFKDTPFKVIVQYYQQDRK